MDIMSRRTAREARASRYYTGRLCQRLHDSQRYTANGSCCECVAEDAAGYSALHGVVLTIRCTSALIPTVEALLGTVGLTATTRSSK